MSDDLPPHMHPTRSFQGLILALQRYWADYGCIILQPYDMEVGAGTFHPATTLRALECGTDMFLTPRMAAGRSSARPAMSA